MERFTQKTDKRNVLRLQSDKGRWAVGNRGQGTLVTITGDAVDRLAHYEDLEEQGRLVVLPCKPGDVLWSFYNRPQKRVCSDRVIDCSYLDGVCMIHSDLWGVTRADAIGKTVFLTRAEAEAALISTPASDVEESIAR